MSQGRWKVRLTNWDSTDPTRPRAVSYLEMHGAPTEVAYASTWREAFDRAVILADAYPWLTVGRIP